MKQATIRDVARHAQVSVASVSRALNGHSNVHPDTRERVMTSVRELGYVPNAAARSLSMAASHSIGVVIPDLHGEFFSELIRGMDKAANERGYLLLLSTMHADVSLAGQALKAMHGRVDGLIVMAPQVDPAELESILPPGLPAVLLICADGRGRPLIGIDNRSGAAMMADHLLSIGRRRLVHLMGPANNIDALERRDGFERRVAATNREATVTTLDGDFSEEVGARAVADFLAGGMPFDAVFAANDMSALGALQELQRQGIPVPDQVAVTGFDDIPLARFMGLSTVRVHMDRLGEEAVLRLLGEIDDDVEAGPMRILIEPELVVRASSGGPR